ncbi:muscle-specific protein 300 kDa-like isoform X2 [Tigriopus californicus]|uniref:muscle-specific protein 300 kDa-like isoform X2 n=1 Tax=Tigriopus californicus TaxID=6832 RepID=UPI0027DA3A0B|nr:muscle-specific protein 300 kDa-like isoform X2 [Tigriopus californicus]
MTFWQENYHFIKDVYDMRHQKMLEWMENVEKAISRIMADKVYTSAEFKRERDNFHALCKDLERAEIKKWLQQILEIIMAERGKEERSEQSKKLDELIEKHENLIPNVLKTQVKVDLYWKCYAYGDELKPHIEFLDGIMLSSTREIAPSCVENVDELIERQEKALNQLETKRNVVNELILKGKALLENPDKPRFLDDHVKRIQEGWDVTKEKASGRLSLLQETKSAWEGYAEGLDSIVVEFEKADEEMKKVKKRFNLEAAFEDLEKRQQIFNQSKTSIEQMYKDLQHNYDVMTMTLPEDKKDFVKKEVKAITDKLDVVGKFEEKVKKIEEFVNNLSTFDKSLKELDKWMTDANTQLGDIKDKSDQMTPEDRVSYTMELSEDISSKVTVIQELIASEEGLLPQGDKCPTDAEEYKAELKRIEKYVTDLQKKVMTECDNFSEDVKFWAEYKTGIKEFKPWLETAETKSTEGLHKPQTLEDANAMFATVKDFAESCIKNLKVLEAATAASLKMTTHKEADSEVAVLKERYAKVKVVADEWVKKVETLVKEWQLLDTTVTELNSWVAEDRKDNSEQQFSLEKMESTLGELKNIFKEKEKLVENL